MDNNTNAPVPSAAYYPTGTGFLCGCGSWVSAGQGHNCISNTFSFNLTTDNSHHILTELKEIRKVLVRLADIMEDK